MKAKEVLKILNISRPTLCKYVKQGLIKVDANINGQYRYNAESVYKLINQNIKNN
jgi:predicted site-specific integrase-resolvase